MNWCALKFLLGRKLMAKLFVQKEMFRINTQYSRLKYSKSATQKTVTVPGRDDLFKILPATFTLYHNFAVLYHRFAEERIKHVRALQEQTGFDLGQPRADCLHSIICFTLIVGTYDLLVDIFHAYDIKFSCKLNRQIFGEI